jgi:hypothetical protein
LEEAVERLELGDLDLERRDLIAKFHLAARLERIIKADIIDRRRRL